MGLKLGSRRVYRQALNLAGKPRGKSFHRAPAAPNAAQPQAAHPGRGKTRENPFPMATVQRGTRAGPLRATCRREHMSSSADSSPVPAWDSVARAAGTKGGFHCAHPALGPLWRIPRMLLWAATNAWGERGSQQSPPPESTSFTRRLEGGERKGRAHV